MKYTEIKGNLITLAQEGKFDVIAHGANCFNNMGAGLAPQMAKAFGCDKFSMELDGRGDWNKLGNINYEVLGYYDSEKRILKTSEFTNTFCEEPTFTLSVVNCYTQYRTSAFRSGKIPLDYEALTLCFRKMNLEFEGLHIGLPYIGCGLAGGNVEKVLKIVKEEFTLCDITMVEYEVPSLSAVFAKREDDETQLMIDSSKKVANNKK